jgi:hypothetical protein
VKVTASVTMPDGSPIDKGEVEVVAPEGVISSGELLDGLLSVETPDSLPSVWALRVNGQPVVAFPVRADKDSVDLGEITLKPDGLSWPVFHADNGIVFGVPTAALNLAPFMAAPPLPQIEVGQPVPVGLLFDSVAKQFARVPPGPQGFKLTSATVTVRGLPSGSGDGFSLEFPTSELARNATGLSELSFGLRPEPNVLSSPPMPQEGLTTPDVSGYTRGFALRKLASLELTATFVDEVVTDPTGVGRVIRQSPKAGDSVEIGAAIRLFIGTSTGAI